MSCKMSQTPLTSRSAYLRGRKRITPHPIAELREVAIPKPKFSADFVYNYGTVPQVHCTADDFMDLMEDNNKNNGDSGFIDQVECTILQDYQFEEMHEIILNSQDF